MLQLATKHRHSPAVSVVFENNELKLPQSYLEVENFEDLPDFDRQADEDTDPDDEVGFVVHHVEHNNHRLEHVEEHRPHRQTFH